MPLPVRAAELHECRQCCAFCDRVVHPAGCIASGCPFLYLYDDEETGRRYMGCMNKVFSGEIDVEMFEAGPADPPRLRRREDDGHADRSCRQSVERAYDGYGEPFDCVNRGFFEKPVADESFDLRDRL